MKNKIKLDNFGLDALKYDEIIATNGGHDGVAYEVGKVVGETIKVAGTLLTIVSIFFMPKS